MTERRYGFRFSGVEGGLFIGSALLASFLIFVSGMYVGKEVAGRKVVTPSQVVRAPVAPFSDPLAGRAPSTSDSTAGQTASTSNVPLEWPVAKEKMTPSTPLVTKQEVLQQTEKEKSRLAQSAVNDPEMKRQREVQSPFVNEENIPSRARPVGESFTPKLPAAVASRTEKATTVVASRGENIDKKPMPITVARVEKTETSARPQALASEARRPLDGKGSGTKLGLTMAKKAEKQSAGWRVQVGATNYQETAQDMARELRELGYSPLVSKVQMNGETLYRVRIGKFNKQGEAMAAVGRFRREGRFSQAYLVSE
jgi:cell division septation protein DedD